MILPYSTLNVVAPDNWSSHKRTVHVPGNHALPPGFSNEAAWELGYSKSEIDPVLGKRRSVAAHAAGLTSGGVREHQASTDLSSPYAQNEASAKLMSLVQRANQLRKIRIPVGGWPSGVIFGMGMAPTVPPQHPPPGGAARNTSMAMAMNKAFEAIQAEALARKRATETGSGGTSKILPPAITPAPGTETRLSTPRSDKTLVKKDDEEDEDAEQQDGKDAKEKRDRATTPALGFAPSATGSTSTSSTKMPALDVAGTSSVSASLDTGFVGTAGTPSGSASKRAPKLVPINAPKPGPTTAEIPPRPPTSLGRLQPLVLSTESGPSNRPLTPLVGTTSASPPSKSLPAAAPPAVSNQPLTSSLSSSSASTLTSTPTTTTTTQLPPATAYPVHLTSQRPCSDTLTRPQTIPYKVAHPHPPPGPPPAVPETIVSNPAFLPEPLARNRRFHSRSINPAYLLQLALAPDPATPESVYAADFCSAPIGGSARGIPGKYLAAYNALAAVNGLPTAQGPHTVTVADPRMHFPATTASIAAATGWGADSMPYFPGAPTSHGPAAASVVTVERDSRGVPNVAIPPLVGPLQGSAKWASSGGPEWQGFGGEPRSNGHAGYTNPAVPFAGGITPGEVAVSSERVTAQWNALLQAPGPVGRRGWNSVGRDHLGNFSHGLSPVTNYRPNYR
ncbi:hypothetical protein HDU96_007786 [Phlyctochytrium bullatum]|nr:hypothetical protein HDU96_007786 [Phlyctochytrium bullatum]